MADQLDISIAKAYAQANVAHKLMQSAMSDFDAYCSAHDWTNAEAARLRAVSHMEAYLDGIASIHKALERG